MTARASILVVEDDPLVAEVVLDALQDSYETRHAANEFDAVEVLRENLVNLILLDCSLPGGLGQDLLTRADGSGIPVLLMSGNPEAAERAGAGRPFVLKPFTLSALVERIQAMLP